MSKTQNDGGPAFPIRTELPLHPDMPTGLTKREYFAGLALQGLLANSNTEGEWVEYAMRARKCADALLEELNEEI